MWHVGSGSGADEGLGPVSSFRDKREGGRAFAYGSPAGAVYCLLTIQKSRPTSRPWPVTLMAPPSPTRWRAFTSRHQTGLGVLTLGRSWDTEKWMRVGLPTAKSGLEGAARAGLVTSPRPFALLPQLIEHSPRLGWTWPWSTKLPNDMSESQTSLFAHSARPAPPLRDAPAGWPCPGRRVMHVQVKS